ncbi:hypothetical protein KIH39_04510 [Telmatocola sphagniphila]|uniref:Uncharacterized protein n=1 Tax=Telmatocola sphagniphila TaxID=1123043 RepID=A0A8E6B8P5_9BACT|nr:hypothetical protein [Telmatocola sphagniphila]QVL33186.1 hypothetical protein KIH39_04510 [Telmatocola sphagniphila]
MLKRKLRLDLLDKKVFWACYLWNLTKGPISTIDADSVDSLFGCTSDQIEEFYITELTDEQEWPVIRIPLHTGESLEIEYANFPEDYEINYKVLLADGLKYYCRKRRRTLATASIPMD